MVLTVVWQFCRSRKRYKLSKIMCKTSSNYDLTLYFRYFSKYFFLKKDTWTGLSSLKVGLFLQLGTQTLRSHGESIKCPIKPFAPHDLWALLLSSIIDTITAGENRASVASFHYDITFLKEGAFNGTPWKKPFKELYICICHLLRRPAILYKCPITIELCIWIQ